MIHLITSAQYITPECRESRGAEGAIDEALRRVRETYMDCAAEEGNIDAHWHVILYRVEEETVAALAMREPITRGRQ
jgi:hypothetical protein